MRTDGITTLNIYNAMRIQASRNQVALLEAQTELSTGRKYDTGLELGERIARNIDWRGQISAFDQQASLNKLAGAKAELTQQGLDQLKTIGDNLIATLVGARTANNGQQMARDAAISAFQSIRDILGTSFKRQNIFSGRNLDGIALKAFGGGASEAAINAAYLAEFGFLPDNQASNSLTPSQMKSFLSTAFAQEFQNPAWNSNWSDATSENLKVRVANDVSLDVSVNANSDGIRKLIQSVVSVMTAAQGKLNTSTFEELTSVAASTAAIGLRGIGEEQTRIGIAQGELKTATDRAMKKSDLLKAQVQESEGVDEYEAAIRVNQLMTKLEASYSVTAKISRLSLVNFI